MPIIIEVVKTPEKLKQVQELRYEAYREDGRFKENDDKITSDRFDDIGVTANLLSTEDGIPIGTTRLTQDSEHGLPVDDLTFQLVDKNMIPVKNSDFKLEIDILRKNQKFNPFLFNIGMLAIKKEYRNNLSLLSSLFNYLFTLAIARQGKIFFITINHKIEKMMKKLSFNIFGKNRLLWSKEINNYIIPMHATIEDVSQVFSKQNIPEEISIFSENFQREIYNRNEAICRKKEIGKSAYLILRGSAAVVDKSHHGYVDNILSILGPGEIFGEMSLFTNKPRCADVIPYSREVEVMVLSSHDLQKAKNDPVKFHGLAKIFTERIRNLNEQIIKEGGYNKKYHKKNSNIKLPQSVLSLINMDRIKTFKKGEIFCQEEECGFEAFIVIDGQVEILVKNVLINIVEPPQLLGEMALINNNPRCATLKAHTKFIKVLTITKDELFRMLRDPAVVNYIFETMCQNIREANETITEKISKKEIIAKNLINILLHYKKEIYFRKAILSTYGNGKKDTEPYNLKWAAEELGYKEGEISNFWGQLKRKGIIGEDKNGNVIIRNEFKLKKIRFLFDLTL